MTLMCHTRGIMRLHGSMRVWRQLRRSNQWRRHTFLNDTSLYSPAVSSLHAFDDSNIKKILKLLIL